MKKVIVKHPSVYAPKDGKLERLPFNAEVELTDGVAANLLKRGLVVDAAAQEAAETEIAQKKTAAAEEKAAKEAERAAAIAALNE